MHVSFSITEKENKFQIRNVIHPPLTVPVTESYTLELLQVTQTESFLSISKNQVMRILIRRLLVDPITNSISRQQVKLLARS